MQVVTGAMGALIPKLFQLLNEEYNLQKGVKQDVKFLTKELPSMHEALRKVADVPRDQLDKQVKIWADEVRELSYVMEDVVDSFLASVEGSQPAANSNKLKELLKKMGNLLPKGKTRRKIAKKIKDIKIQVKEVADRRDRYGVNDAVANLAAAPTPVDPRLLALFKEQKDLVGIDAARDEITKKLTDGDGDVAKQKLKILSIFGIGGLGKTTVAKVVHQKLQAKFMLKAFVSVGQKPDVKKVLRDIFLELDKEGYRKSNAQMLDEKQLIVELQELLENKRYFIVIDDIWDVEAWKIISYALKDSNCGSKIITTTRSLEVAKKSEDCTIAKNTLIWKWVGEGFIEEEQGIGQHELGERYFNELVNRSMIQPIMDNYGSCSVTGCRVHDLVLDMICLLSNEENFVRVWDVNDQRISCQSNARRLAIQKKVLEQDDSLANMCTPQLRSFYATECDVDVMPSLSSFGALRILDMADCYSSIGDGGYHLDHLGSLVHLRYLGLRSMPIYKLPEEIGNLKFLQTLDLFGTRIKELPHSFGLLRQLKCMYFEVHEGTVGMHLLGNLTSLEELRLILFYTWSPEFVAELGKLTMLRELILLSFTGQVLNDSRVKALVKSLVKLQKIEVLCINFPLNVRIGHQDWEGYVPPRQLQELSLGTPSDMLPVWINPSLIPNVTSLWLMVEEVKARDMEILGSFPELITLWLRDNVLANSLPDVMGGLFPKLRHFCTPAPLRFLQGAMPSLESLEYCSLQVDQLKRDSSFVFEFGSWENLHSLQKVVANVNSVSAQENEDEAVFALGLAANQHPNRPNLTIKN
ncbi:hypothetical protein ZWY2020_032071 [Hordeum vulgare]|nr:hypothetical protein ZWY2020_032071 [Hordeum vulgare]